MAAQTHHRSAASEPLIRCIGITKSFGNQRVLDGVDFDVGPGEVHVLAGENGAGKSTLVKILCGVHQPDLGEISVGGRCMRFRSVHDASIAGVAMIHQELSLAPALSVIDNLFLGRERANRLGWLDRRGQRREALEALQRVGLDVEPSVAVGSLPLAVRQLVEIAKALMRDASVIIMDEPTSALPRPDVERLFALIHRLRSNAARPVGVIYITHRMEEIYRVADRITVLRDGRHVMTSRAADLPREALVHAMVGRAVDERASHDRFDVEEELLRVERLCVQGPRGLTVRDASLSLHRGEVVGLAGLQGSGTGSLLHALFGDRRIVSGSVVVQGRRGAPGSPIDAMRRGLALLTDDRKATGLCQGLSIAGNLTLPSITNLSPAGVRRIGRESAAAAAGVKAFGIRCRSPRQIVSTLSGGNQQKVALGKWLLREPSILLLNDPTRGVDIGARQELYGLIRAATNRGAAILMTSSDLPELLALSDRIVAMHRGVMTAEFARADATPQNVMAAAMDANDAITIGSGAAA